MKNMNKYIIGMVVISALITGPAYAEGSGACPTCEGKGFHKDKGEGITRQLNLTAEQDKLLKDSKAAHRAEMEQLMKALKEKRQELKDALAKSGVTKEQVDPIASQIKGLQAQMVDRRIDGILKVKGILTPEQFQKLQAMKEVRQSKRRAKRWDKKE